MHHGGRCLTASKMAGGKPKVDWNGTEGYMSDAIQARAVGRQMERSSVLKAVVVVAISIAVTALQCKCQDALGSAAHDLEQVTRL